MLTTINKISLRVVREPGLEYICTGPIQAHDILKFMGDLAEERFIALHLDVKNNIIGYQEVSVGILSSSLVHPREVFKGAILSNSSAIIVAHNHPSGDLTPSDNDITVTKKLVSAGRLLDIPVQDHLIISFKGVRSLRSWDSHLWA